MCVAQFQTIFNEKQEKNTAEEKQNIKKYYIILWIIYINEENLYVYYIYFFHQSLCERKSGNSDNPVLSHMHSYMYVQCRERW